MKQLHHLPVTIHTPSDVVRHCHSFAAKPQEFVIGMYLSSRHQVITQKVISIGTVNSSIIHARELFAPAIQCRASSLVLIHNHPSGNPEPSPEDIETTARMVAAGKTLDIPLFDHIILSKNTWCSLRQLGHL